MIYIFFTILNLLIYLNLEKISKFINIFDKPDKKIKRHKGNIALLGGVILFVNLCFYIFNQLFFLDEFLMLKNNLLKSRDIFVVIFFIFSFFFIGLFDDKFKIKPSLRLFLITIVSLTVLLIEKDLIITKLSLSFYPNKIFLNEFSLFFTLFCIIILINALNFYDGINGQSGIFYLIVFSYLYFISFQNYFYLFLILVIIFDLFLNLRNKIFFGDSGVYLVSSIVIISLIYEHNINKNIIYADQIFFLLLIPGLDLVRLTLERLFSHKNIFNGDREHLHHLLHSKFDLIKTNLILLILNLLPIIFFVNAISFYFNFVFILIVYLSLVIYLKKKL